MAVAEQPQTQVKLVKLNPADILMLWTLLFSFIRSSGLYKNDLKIVQMMLDAMIWRVELWVLRREQEEGFEFVGVLGTKVYETPYTEEFIFSLVHGNIRDDAVMSTKEWQLVYKSLIRYARDLGCSAVEVFSVHPRVQRLLSGFGFEVNSYRKGL